MFSCCVDKVILNLDSSDLAAFKLWFHNYLIFLGCILCQLLINHVNQSACQHYNYKSHWSHSNSLSAATVCKIVVYWPFVSPPHNLNVQDIAPFCNCHSSLALNITVSLLLSHSISLCVSPPSSPSQLPLSAVSPLISPVQSAGRHMPSVCRASGDVSCAGVPPSTHNRYGERVECCTFAAASRSCLV